MIVENHTPYPDAEVARIVVQGYGRGPRPQRVMVGYRTLPNDTRLGFTPFDHRRPTWLWVEPPARYPQPGARSWREELFLSAAHEAYHYRDRGPCPAGRCEVAAERAAHTAQRHHARRAR